MKIFYSPRCLEYEQLGHPENPDRVKRTADLLQKEKYILETPLLCTEEDVLQAHSKSLLESLKKNTFFEPDTPCLPGMAVHAMRSAGAAILACETAAAGENAFSLMRPPGHHATRSTMMGFCYLNSMAISIAAYLAKKPDSKIAILDIDCHHGNGTEDIFSGNPSVLFISLHQSPCYPGTGLKSGQNCLNYPLPPETEETDYLKTLETACENIANFNPALIGVSAGFDTYKDDPITQFGLEIGTYSKISRIIAGLGKPVFAILEGGYSRDLPECVLELIRGL